MLVAMGPTYSCTPILDLSLRSSNDIVTHSQLLEGLKCESQTENNRKARSRGTFLGLQHFGRVEGRVRAPR